MKVLTGIVALVFIAMSATFTAMPTSVAQSNRQQPKPQATPQRPQEVGEGDDDYYRQNDDYRNRRSNDWFRRIPWPN